MEMNQILAEAEAALANWGLDKFGWKAVADQGKKRAGSCNYARKQITLSALILPNATPAEITETILHEVAHALTPGHNHDHVWRAKLVAMGGTGARTHRMETPKGRYELQCEKCGVVGHRHQAQGTMKRLLGENYSRLYYHRTCGGGLRLVDTQTKTPVAYPVAASSPTPVGSGPACRCQCGGFTRGGHYLPGHDARHVSAVFAEWLAGGVDYQIAKDRLAHAPKLQAKLTARIEAYANRNYK